MEGLLARETQAERLSILETEVRIILANQKEFNENWQQVNEKLDSLVSLKHKGVGAFWVASSLVGTGIIGFLATLFDWLKG